MLASVLTFPLLLCSFNPPSGKKNKHVFAEHQFKHQSGSDEQQPPWSGTSLRIKRPLNTMIFINLGKFCWVRTPVPRHYPASQSHARSTYKLFSTTTVLLTEWLHRSTLETCVEHKSKWFTSPSGGIYARNPSSLISSLNMLQSEPSCRAIGINFFCSAQRSEKLKTNSRPWWIFGTGRAGDHSMAGGATHHMHGGSKLSGPGDSAPHKAGAELPQSGTWRQPRSCQSPEEWLSLHRNDGFI